MALIAGRTFVLLGESGAGKSTLVNRLAGEELLATAEVQRSGAGRHTTTHRQLVVLDGVGVAIDTPGVRMAGFWGTAEDVSRAFADIEELAAQCRFADCAHGSEPGCAVRGAVSPDRLAAYDHTLREQRALEVRLDPRLASERRKQWRTMARFLPARQLEVALRRFDTRRRAPPVCVGTDEGRTYLDGGSGTADRARCAPYGGGLADRPRRARCGPPGGGGGGRPRGAGVAAGFDPPTALDLLVVDPDDATVEVRASAA